MMIVTIAPNRSSETVSWGCIKWHWAWVIVINSPIDYYEEEPKIPCSEENQKSQYVWGTC